MMGFELIENFNQPYFAPNITDFWRRWHISLSTWLRDYLYIPLGGNRHGKLNTYRNLFLTMFLGGLWHGASWKFAVWGSLHGIYLAVHKFMMERAPAATLGPPASSAPELQNSAEAPAPGGGLPAVPRYSLARPSVKSGGGWAVRAVKTMVTFHLVALTWIFFTADNVHVAFKF